MSAQILRSMLSSNQKHKNYVLFLMNKINVSNSYGTGMYKWYTSNILKRFIYLIFDLGEVVNDDAEWRKALLVALAGY